MLLGLNWYPQPGGYASDRPGRGYGNGWSPWTTGAGGGHGQGGFKSQGGGYGDGAGLKPKGEGKAR